MTQQRSPSTKDSIEPLLYNVTLTGRLRWLKVDKVRTLQQEYRNVFTGKTEWRDIEIVTKAESNGND